LQGQVYFRHPKQTVPVRGPNGEIGTIEASEAENSFRNGWTAISPDEFKKADDEARYGGLKGSAIAGAEGVARGVSGGLSDPLATGVASVIGGKPYAQAVRRHLASYKSTNPISAGVGEATGFVGGALASGGSNLAEEGLAKGATELAAADVAAPAAKAAVTGLAPATDATALVTDTQSLARQELEKLSAQQSATGIVQPESALEATQKLATPKPPVIGPDGLPLDPTLVHAAPTPPPGVASPLSAISVEAPKDLPAAAQHIASRIAEQPGIAKTILGNTPAAYIARTGRAAEDLAQGAVTELFGTEVAASATGRVLTGAVKYGASGAIEQGLMSMGSEVSEDTLGDHDVNAQKLLAAFGHGALLGASFGSALGTAGGIARETSSAFLQKFAPQLNELKGLAAFKAAGAGGGRGAVEKDLLREYGPGGIADAGNTLIRYHVIDGAPDAEGIYNNIIEARTGVGGQLGDLIPGDATVRLEDVEKAIMARNPEAKGHEILQEMRRARNISNIAGLTNEELEALPKLKSQVEGPLKMDFESKLREYHHLDNVARNMQGPEQGAARVAADNAFVEKEASYASLKAHRDELNELVRAEEGSSLQKQMMAIRNVFDKNGVASVEALRRERMRIDGNIKQWGKASVTGPELPAQQMLLKHLRGTLEDIIVDSGEQSAGIMGKQWVSQYRGLKKDYHVLSLMQKKAEGSLAAKFRNQGFSLSSKMLGAAELMHAGAMAVPKAAALMVAHKMFRDRGMAASALVLDKLSQMALIQKTAAQVDRTIEAGTDGLLSRLVKSGEGKPRLRIRTLGRSPEAPEDHVEAHADARKQVTYVAALANMPKVAKEHAAIALGGDSTYAPKTASSLASRANAVTQYLISKLPPGHDNLQDITGGSSQGNLSDAQMRVFTAHVEGATDVKAVARKLATGHLTAEHVEALKTAAPAIHDMIVANLMKGLSEMDPKDKERIPYQGKLELSQILNMPVDWSTQPSAIRIMQADDVKITQSDGRPAQGEQKPGRPAPSKLKNTLGAQTDLSSESKIGPRTQEH
jgi:hypothetical protein